MGESRQAWETEMAHREWKEAHRSMGVIVWGFLALCFWVAVLAALALCSGCVTRKYENTFFMGDGDVTLEVLVERTTSGTASVPIGVTP